ncbi:MAG TPA: demethoxyubiquinone hydroxylase family protein [Anaerolineae bacterium]|nr:demethoxyubiquinone hydroxylase family protein [Anaerolineae bacterium]HPL29641.1 demethoxyubiquinone hydroxylase family protein [Anaerolineae bacterium]
MSTDPFITLVPRKMSASELARAIRLDIASEIDATNLYQAHIDATDDERAKAVLAHIRDEEKEHIAEFIQLLALLDPTQAQELQTAPGNIAQILSEGEVEPTAAGETPRATWPRGQLTVGSLMGKP